MQDDVYPKDDRLTLQLVVQPRRLDALLRGLADELADIDVASWRERPTWDEEMWDAGYHLDLSEQHYDRLVKAFRQLAISEVTNTFDGMKYSTLEDSEAPDCTSSCVRDPTWKTGLERFKADDIEF